MFRRVCLRLEKIDNDYSVDWGDAASSPLLATPACPLAWGTRLRTAAKLSLAIVLSLLDYSGNVQ